MWFHAAMALVILTAFCEATAVRAAYRHERNEIYSGIHQIQSKNSASNSAKAETNTGRPAAKTTNENAGSWEQISSDFGLFIPSSAYFRNIHATSLVIQFQSCLSVRCGLDLSSEGVIDMYGHSSFGSPHYDVYSSQCGVAEMAACLKQFANSITRSAAAAARSSNAITSTANHMPAHHSPMHQLLSHPVQRGLEQSPMHAVAPASIAIGPTHACMRSSNGAVMCWGSGGKGQIGDGLGQDQPQPVAVVGMASGVLHVSVGHTHTCGVTEAGEVMCWGDSSNGRLGSTVTRSGDPTVLSDAWVPRPVNGSASYVWVSAGEAHTCAIGVDKCVYCWGSGQYGRLGMTNSSEWGDRLMPEERMPGLPCYAVAVEAGTNITCAVMGYSGDNTYCWGFPALPSHSLVQSSNHLPYHSSGVVQGKLPLLPPHIVSGISCSSSLSAAAARACCVDSSGRGVCFGLVADAFISATWRLTRTLPYENVTSIVTSASQVCVTQADTAAIMCRSWPYLSVDVIAAGTNECAMNGLTTNTTICPMEWRVTGAAAHAFVMPNSVFRHMCVYRSGRGVKCWGSGTEGELGDGNKQSSSQPVLVADLPTQGPMSLTQSRGGRCTCASLLATGEVKCWGECKLESSASTLTPKPVPGIDGLTPATTAMVVTGENRHRCVLLESGGVKCWGQGDLGRIGDGYTTNRFLPTTVTGINGTSDAYAAVAICTGGDHTCVIMSGGGVKCWGSGTFRQLGNGDTSSSSVPVDVVGLDGSSPTATAMYIDAAGTTTCVITGTGGVKCWGYSGLGNDSPSAPTVPVDVIGLGPLQSGPRALQLVVGGIRSCVIVDEPRGALKCWGDRPGGGAWSSATPVDVIGFDGSSADAMAVKVAIGSMHTCAVTATGAVKCWGANGNGQLGNDGPDDSAIPVHVIGLDGTSDAFVVGIATGSTGTCAMTDDGCMWCWGSDYSSGSSGVTHRSPLLRATDCDRRTNTTTAVHTLPPQVSVNPNSAIGVGDSPTLGDSLCAVPLYSDEVLCSYCTPSPSFNFNSSCHNASDISFAAPFVVLRAEGCVHFVTASHPNASAEGTSVSTSTALGVCTREFDKDIAVPWMVLTVTPPYDIPPSACQLEYEAQQPVLSVSFHDSSGATVVPLQSVRSCARVSSDSDALFGTGYWSLQLHTPQLLASVTTATNALTVTYVSLVHTNDSEAAEEPLTVNNATIATAAKGTSLPTVRVTSLHGCIVVGATNGTTSAGQYAGGTDKLRCFSQHVYITAEVPMPPSELYTSAWDAPALVLKHNRSEVLVHFPAPSDSPYFDFTSQTIQLRYRLPAWSPLAQGGAYNMCTHSVHEVRLCWYRKGIWRTATTYTTATHAFPFATAAHPNVSAELCMPLCVSSVAHVAVRSRELLHNVSTTVSSQHTPAVLNCSGDTIIVRGRPMWVDPSLTTIAAQDRSEDGVQWDWRLPQAINCSIVGPSARPWLCEYTYTLPTAVVYPYTHPSLYLLIAAHNNVRYVHELPLDGALSAHPLHMCGVEMVSVEADPRADPNFLYDVNVTVHGGAYFKQTHPHTTVRFDAQATACVDGSQRWLAHRPSSVTAVMNCKITADVTQRGSIDVRLGREAFALTFSAVPVIDVTQSAVTAHIQSAQKPCNTSFAEKNAVEGVPSLLCFSSTRPSLAFNLTFDVALPSPFTLNHTSVTLSAQPSCTPDVCTSGVVIIARDDHVQLGQALSTDEVAAGARAALLPLSAHVIGVAHTADPYLTQGYVISVHQPTSTKAATLLDTDAAGIEVRFRTSSSGTTITVPQPTPPASSGSTHNSTYESVTVLPWYFKLASRPCNALTLQWHLEAAAEYAHTMRVTIPVADTRVTIDTDNMTDDEVLSNEWNSRVHVYGDDGLNQLRNEAEQVFRLQYTLEVGDALTHPSCTVARSKRPVGLFAADEVGWQYAVPRAAEVYTVVVTDKDTAGLEAPATLPRLGQGESMNYTLHLSSRVEVAVEVEIEVSVSDEYASAADIHVTPATVVIPPHMWGTPVSVRVTYTHNEQGRSGQGEYTLTHTVRVPTSTAEGYAGDYANNDVRAVTGGSVFDDCVGSLCSLEAAAETAVRAQLAAEGQTLPDSPWWRVTVSTAVYGDVTAVWTRYSTPASEPPVYACVSSLLFTHPITVVMAYADITGNSQPSVYSLAGVRDFAGVTCTASVAQTSDSVSAGVQLQGTSATVDDTGVAVFTALTVDASARITSPVVLPVDVTCASAKAEKVTTAVIVHVYPLRISGFSLTSAASTLTRASDGSLWIMARSGEAFASDASARPLQVHLSSSPVVSPLQPVIQPPDQPLLQSSASCELTPSIDSASLGMTTRDSFTTLKSSDGRSIVFSQSLRVHAMPGTNVSAIVSCSHARTPAHAATLHFRLEQCVQGQVIEAMSLTCVDCPQHSYSLVAVPRQLYTAEGTVAQRSNGSNSQGADVCIDCPVGLVCSGGRLLRAEAGYYRAWKGSTHAVPCAIPSACAEPAAQLNATGTDLEWLHTPSDTCVYPYRGRGCSACDEGYGRLAGECVSCPPVTVLLTSAVVGAIVLCCVMAGMMYTSLTASNNRHDISSSLTKIIANHMQVVSIASGLQLQWPPVVSALLTAVTVLSSPASSGAALPLECYLNWLTSEGVGAFYVMQILMFGVPFMGVLVIGLVVCARKRAACKRSTRGTDVVPGQPQGRTCAKWFKAHVQQVWMACAIVFLYLIHPTLTRRSALMYSCEEWSDERYLSPQHSPDWANVSTARGGWAHAAAGVVQVREVEWYLIEDRDTLCWNGWWTWGLGSAYLLLFVLGIPAALTALLWAFKDKLGEDSTRSGLGFMYMGYKRDAWYWEVLVMLRKAVLVYIIVMLAPAGLPMQITTTTLCILGFIILHMHVQPYKSREVQTTEVASLGVQGCTLLCGQYYFPGTAAPQWVQWVCTCVLVGSNAVLLVWLLLRVCMLKLRKLGKRKGATKKVRVNHGCGYVEEVRADGKGMNKYSSVEARGNAIHERKECVGVRAIERSETNVFAFDNPLMRVQSHTNGFAK